MNKLRRLKKILKKGLPVYYRVTRSDGWGGGDILKESTNLQEIRDLYAKHKPSDQPWMDAEYHSLYYWYRTDNSPPATYGGQLTLEEADNLIEYINEVL